MAKECYYKIGLEHSKQRLEEKIFTLKFSSSLACFCTSCLWRALFSSNILFLLEWIWDCTRDRVCMHLRVFAVCLLTVGPSTSDFSLTSPLKALNALLACKRWMPTVNSLIWQLALVSVLYFLNPFQPKEPMPSPRGLILWPPIWNSNIGAITLLSSWLILLVLGQYMMLCFPSTA